MPEEDVSMSLQFHPRMQADGTLSPSQEESPEGTPAEATPPTPTETPTAPAEQTAPTAPIGEDDGYIRISKTDPYDDIRRAAQADPEFNRRVREFAGRETRRNYEEEITRLRAENAQKDRELRRREIVEMTPEEREEKFRTDPDFARAYTEIIHPSEDEDSDPVIQSEASYYENTREDLFDDARDAKMPAWRIKQFEDAFHTCPVHKTSEHGFYDHDANGEFFDARYSDPALARKASFDFFQRTLNAELRQVQAAAAQAAAQQPPAKTEPSAPPPEAPADASQASGGAGAPNAALQRSSPDVSPRSTGGSGPAVRYTNDDLIAMGVDKRIALVESMGGRKKMIEDGTLYVPGLSEKVHGQALPR